MNLFVLVIWVLSLTVFLWADSTQARSRYYEVCDSQSACLISSVVVGPGDHFWLLRKPYLLEFDQGLWWRHDLPVPEIHLPPPNQNRYIYSKVLLDRSLRPLVMIFDRTLSQAKVFRLNEKAEFQLLFNEEDIQNLKFIPKNEAKIALFEQGLGTENWFQADSWNQVHLNPFWEYQRVIDREDQIWQGSLILNRFDIRTGHTTFYPQIGAVEPLFEDNQGNLWLKEEKNKQMQNQSITQYRLIKRTPMGQFSYYPEAKSLDEAIQMLPSHVFAQSPQWGAQDRKGYIYRKHKGRLEVFYKNQWQTIYSSRPYEPKGNYDNIVMNFMIDHYDVIWLNTATSIERLLPASPPTARKAETLWHFPIDHEFPDKQFEEARSVKMHVDTHNTKWFFHLPSGDREQFQAPGILKYVEGQGFVSHRFE